MKVARLFTVVALGALIASPMAAQDTHGNKVSAVAKPAGKDAPKKESLKSLAKISKDSASKIALSKVAAGSKVKSSALEREKGTVVYAFDISVPNTTGVEEILVSAIDGSVVSQTHETPAMEKAEKAKDKQEKKDAKAAAKKP